MNFKSQISTTHEQSQRLIDLGLNPATADMILSPDNHPMCTPYSQNAGSLQGTLYSCMEPITIAGYNAV